MLKEEPLMKFAKKHLNYYSPNYRIYTPMKRHRNKIRFAEFEKGKVYALPLEEVSGDSAAQIGQIAECTIVLLPSSCFNRTLKNKRK